LAVIPVLVVLVLLSASGWLALRSLLRVEQATEVVRGLDPDSWRGATIEMSEATDRLRVAVAERIDG